MIFNLFKSKPTLKELIPKGFVDIHSHILPGIDDGAKDISESSELIKKMKEIGFSKIIGTPHTYPGFYDNSNNSIKESFQKIKNLNIKNVTIGFASEYMIDESLIEKSKNEELLTLKDNYILIELPFIDLPNYCFEVLFQLNTNGYKTILAHPERYKYLSDDKFKFLKKLKSFGCKFQLNLLSLTGHYGKNVLNFSEKLIKFGYIDFVGSDTHNIIHLKKFNKNIMIKRNNIRNLEHSINKTKDIFF